MKTRTTEVRPVYVEAICAECGQSIEREPYTITFYPPQYDYICKTEGCAINGQKVRSKIGYPRISFVADDGRAIG